MRRFFTHCRSGSVSAATKLLLHPLTCYLSLFLRAPVLGKGRLVDLAQRYKSESELFRVRTEKLMVRDKLYRTIASTIRVKQYCLNKFRFYSNLQRYEKYVNQAY